MECALVVQAVAVASIGALGAEAHGDMSGCQVHDGGGNEERRNLARARLRAGRVFALDDIESADARADVNADPLRIFRRDFQPATSSSPRRTPPWRSG